MEMTGERRIPAPRETVWRALNDPEVLKASIPGCEHIAKLSDTEFAARVALRIGPMNARFSGKVELSDLDPPNGYRISGEGQGGVAGFAKGGATVRLVEDGPGATLMTYDVKAQVGGKMAQLGARLIDSTARSMADQFFDRFVARVAADVGAEAQTQPAAPAAGASLGALLRFPPPAEIAGLPTVFWGGLAVWIVIVLLMVL
jgi:carbon monoxide dehydrogenase subunit G